MLHRIVVLLVGLVVLGVPAGATAEGGCSNEALRPAGSYASRLSDCRAFEQVTPVSKDGASPSAIEGGVQASPSGERLIFLVPTNMPGAEGAFYPPLFLASRVGEGWSNQGLQLPVQPHGKSRVVGWSEDLSEALDEAREVGPGAGLGVYLRDSASGSFQRAFPVEKDEGGEGNEVYPAGFSSDDSRLIFESESQLLPSAAAGKTNLYEWHAGALNLAGVLPDGSTPPGGSFAGSYDWYSGQGYTSRGGATSGYYTQNTISSDGSRVFFTAGETGQLYVRKNGASTVQVSASQRTVPDPNGIKPAAFMAATPDGSRVFFTSCQKLTNDSTAVSTAEASCRAEGEGQDLYEYNVGSGALADLSVDGTAGDAQGAAVQGVLGVASGPGGTYVYFAASGVLASGASPGSCIGSGICKLYLWHNGTVSFIAALSAEDQNNWRPRPFVGMTHASRVTPDGRTLLFSSQRQLTSYDNRGFNEFYRYDAVSGRLVCVSCAPSGAPPTGSAGLRSLTIILGAIEPSILMRNLSADGSRVFFESPDALVPQDTNNTQDVYEWELAGTGSCQESSGSFSAASGGCLYLISTGRSPDASYFADASASGNDVFFFTDQPLVGQDQDGLVDVYDARVGGGIAAQSPPSPSAPCGGEACRGPAGSAPVFPAPSSAVFSGAGNLVPVASTPLAKPRAKKPKPKKKKTGRKHKKAKKALARDRSAKRAHQTARRGK
ncbi:MAG TPA: hypothetical protein VGY76_03795 [Solirubrobacteraceae bacterium]|nr:hypothetical protein [Solirubrobacteraceae bacterium]